MSYQHTSIRMGCSWTILLYPPIYSGFGRSTTGIRITLLPEVTVALYAGPIQDLDMLVPVVIR